MSVGRHKEERRDRRVVVSWNRERGGRVIMKRGVIIEANEMGGEWGENEDGEKVGRRRKWLRAGSPKKRDLETETRDALGHRWSLSLLSPPSLLSSLSLSPLSSLLFPSRPSRVHRSTKLDIFFFIPSTSTPRTSLPFQTFSLSSLSLPSLSSSSLELVLSLSLLGSRDTQLSFQSPIASGFC